MNRAELQVLAEERIKDAKALLDAGRWGFAYYTAGYAVECALKSCVLSRMIYTGWVFQEKWEAKHFRTHEFEELIKLAGMRSELDTRLAARNGTPVPFNIHWDKVKEWKVDHRYLSRTELEAKELYEAITNLSEGVLSWIKNYW